MNTRVYLWRDDDEERLFVTQANITRYHPFRMGGEVGHPAKSRRCTAKPTVIVSEEVVAKDGLRGSMSLCDSCLQVFQSMGTAYTKVKLTRVK